MTIASIPLNRITHNPWQTRQGEPDPEYIKSLALDIAANSLLQAPVGRLILNGVPTDPNLVKNYGGAVPLLRDEPETTVQLAFGHNRLAAYQWLHETENGEPALQWDSMPVDLRALTDEQMAIMAWSENEKRRDHTPIERARAIEKRMADFGWSQAQVADQLGISRPAVSNSLRLLKLPEDVLAAIASGAVPERTAVALVSLFDLPESMRTRAERNYRLEPSKIVREALSGEINSDAVRKNVEEICNNYSSKLGDADFKIGDEFDIENIRSATCKDCLLRIKERNLCQDPDCFARKALAARTQYLIRASIACNIPMIEDPHTSYYEVTRFLSYHNENEFKTIQAAGCPNLRLMYVKTDPGNNRDEPARVKGHPSAIVVCAKREQFCTCLQGLKALSNQNLSAGSDGKVQPDAEELKEFAREARKEKRDAKQQAHFVMEEAAQRIAVGLNQRIPETWIALMRSDYHHADWKSRDMWEIFLALASDLANTKMPYEIDSLRQVTKGMNDLLESCGLEPIELPAGETISGSDLPEPEGKTLAEVFSEQESEAAP